MTVQVHNSPDPSRDDDVAACEVVTVDAAGVERHYRVTLTGDIINGRSILSGKRIDDHDYDRHPDAPTRRVYDTARQYFREQGYDVYDGG